MEKAANDEDNAVEAYSERVVTAVLGFAETASIALGDARGWYAALVAIGSVGMSSTELPAGSSGAQQRRFRLPAGAAEVLVKQDSLVALLPMVRMLRAGVAQMPNLLEVFRDGGGVPWVHLGAEARESQTERNKSWFEQRLASAVA